MEKKNFNKSVMKEINFDSIDIGNNIEHDIKEYSKEFNIDRTVLNNIEIPKDLKKSANSSFEGVKKDCKITNNLSILNPRIINNPGIYSLLNN